MRQLEPIAAVAQAVAIIAACWAIISGVGAWKREFLGKRRIELAEEVLAAFFELRDAVAFIRNPFSSAEEGKSRQRDASEREEESALLDRGYIVHERYQKRESVFVVFNTLKYRAMAAFGAECENVWRDTNAVLNSIFASAYMLANHYWQRQGRVTMSEEEFKQHLDEMHQHEHVFWDGHTDPDPIRAKLDKVQADLEGILKPYFEEPMGLYAWLTKKRQGLSG